MAMIFLKALKKEKNLFLFPFARFEDSIENKKFEGLLYMDKKGNPQVFTGCCWEKLSENVKVFVENRFLSIEDFSSHFQEKKQ